MSSFLKFTICLSLVLASAGAFAGSQKLSTITEQGRQTFIIMRHADKQKGVDPNLTEKGRQQAKKSAAALETLRQEQGKEKIRIVVSNLKRSQETGKIMAQELGIPESDIIIDPRICEHDQGPIAKTAKESKKEMYQRMHDGIRETLNAYGSPEILTVFVSHGTVMQNYFTLLSYQKQNIIPFYFQQHHVTACEMYLIHREDDNFIAEKNIRAG